MPGRRKECGHESCRTAGAWPAPGWMLQLPIIFAARTHWILFFDGWNSGGRGGMHHGNGIGAPFVEHEEMRRQTQTQTETPLVTNTPFQLSSSSALLSFRRQQQQQQQLQLEQIYATTTPILHRRGGAAGSTTVVAVKQITERTKEILE